jgi:hypothetical protein
MSPAQFDSFAKFWPYYVRAHRKAATRGLHFCGTTLSLGMIVAAIWQGPWLLAAAPVVGYGLSWTGHFVCEKNRPATFGHPWWSLLGDFKMWGLILAGRMAGEVERICAADRATD